MKRNASIIWLCLLVGFLAGIACQDPQQSPEEEESYPAGLPAKLGYCGNENIDLLESCDDGNTLPGDGCSEHCMIEGGYCGDGEWNVSEGCDDGNTRPGDGCGPDCRLEYWYCDDWHVDLYGECERYPEAPASAEETIIGVPGGDYPLGNSELSIPGDPSSPSLPAQIVHLDAFRIESIPTGPFNWFEASAICAERGGRLPDERQWEAAFRLNQGDGSDFPNPLDLTIDADEHEWTNTCMSEMWNPRIEKFGVQGSCIVKNFRGATAARELRSINLDPIGMIDPGAHAALFYLYFRCVYDAVSEDDE